MPDNKGETPRDQSVRGKGEKTIEKKILSKGEFSAVSGRETD